MSETEGEGFVVRDKRGRTAEVPPAAEPRESAPSSTEATSSSEPSKGASSEGPGASNQSSAPPLTFSTFIFSLGTSALMLMGESLSQEQGPTTVNLPQAKEIIEILAMLETKTQGNLTSEEQTVLREMLYTLRMKYVDAASGTSNVSST